MGRQSFGIGSILMLSAPMRSANRLIATATDADPSTLSPPRWPFASLPRRRRQRKVVDRGDIATKSRSPGPGRGHPPQRPEMGILLGDGASSPAGDTPLKTRFSIMLIAGLVACTGLPVQAAEPIVAGLWRRRTRKPGNRWGGLCLGRRTA